MFTAMKFEPTGFNDNVVVRAVRTKPFKTEQAARSAVVRSGREGYVKQVGHSIPVWHNCKLP